MKVPIIFQETIITSGTAQSLPSNPVFSSVTITASAGNAGDIVLGNSSSVTVLTGFILGKGQSVLLELQGNTDQLWVVGTAGDSYSVVGI